MTKYTEEYYNKRIAELMTWPQMIRDVELYVVAIKELPHDQAVQRMGEIIQWHLEHFVNREIMFGATEIESKYYDEDGSLIN